MSEVFELPSLGADMESGTLLEWYVGPGDSVERGSVVALVSTEKADIDVEIWQTGTVDELLIDVDTEIPVGTPILRLSSDVSAPSAPAAASSNGSPPPGPAERMPVASPAPPPAGEMVAASPLARESARIRGIDLGAIKGSGPGGAVLIRDVEPVIESDQQRRAAPESSPVEDRSASMRQAIAVRMARANTEIPHYFLEKDIDVGPMQSWLHRHNADLPVAKRVVPAAVLLKATAMAAAKVPELNGFWVGERFEPAPAVDLAVVVSLRGGGLVTPRLSEVDQIGVDEIMAGLNEIVSGARRGSLRSSWMTGAGLTVTNLGDRGADRVSGVIFPPQVALVGFGAVRDRAWVVDGGVEVRPVITASLAADHRATDGAIGSRFLSALAAELQNTEES